ncbi:MAG: radical SAM protein [Proteobacteria bacterium]|nr:radical SAM protein [Pseudomonadota bacterium]MBU4275771.1 radical SAM protein [Pseudomonadota bacterium]MBU4383806.1 radical SAM protein [Pseudomonadota bacterium]MBU4605889.1 radical SAM protein [Pseudomonadota bacterium]MCG2763448.1 radical SAM protein [Desulfarculaceae bacterium]
MYKLKVCEIFLSLQGESSFVGMPCVFVRTSGCPLECTWCDTAYAKTEGREMILEEILGQVAGLGVELVELTGGEPLAQDATPRMMEMFLQAGYSVLLETSGAVSLAPVPEEVYVIMDLKCPSSGMHERMHWPNLDMLRPHHEVKFVVADRADYDYAHRLMENHRLAERARVLFSCVHGAIAPREVAGWILEDRLPVRFQLPLHKELWPEVRRGV